MNITVYEARAFLVGAGLGEALKLLEDKDVILLATSRLNDIGITVKITDSEPVMKWVALLKVLDITLSGEWHSGSATREFGKVGFDSYEEACAWIENKRAEYTKNTHREYQFTPCVLSYDESQSKNIAGYFRHMS